MKVWGAAASTRADILTGERLHKKKLLQLPASSCFYKPTLPACLQSFDLWGGVLREACSQCANTHIKQSSEFGRELQYKVPLCLGTHRPLPRSPLQLILHMYCQFSPILYKTKFYIQLRYFTNESNRKTWANTQEWRWLMQTNMNVQKYVACVCVCPQLIQFM